MKGKGPNLRTWGFVAGGAALLALLTLVLCLLGGVFNFSPSGKTSAPVSAATMTPPPVVPTAMQTVDPMATPRPIETPAEQSWNISVIGGVGGVVTPSGLVQVLDGESVTLTITPDSGFDISEMKVDGKTVDPAGSYTFTKVTENHSFYVVFRALPAETPPPDTPVSASDIA